MSLLDSDTLNKSGDWLSELSGVVDQGVEILSKVTGETKGVFGPTTPTPVPITTVAAPPVTSSAPSLFGGSLDLKTIGLVGGGLAFLYLILR